MAVAQTLPVAVSRRRVVFPIVAPLALVLASASGAIVATHPKQGIGLVAAVAVALIVAADIRYLPILLTFTIFVESVSAGSGLRGARGGSGELLFSASPRSPREPSPRESRARRVECHTRGAERTVILLISL